MNLFEKGTFANDTNYDIGKIVDQEFQTSTKRAFDLKECFNELQNGKSPKKSMRRRKKKKRSKSTAFDESYAGSSSPINDRLMIRRKSGNKPPNFTTGKKAKRKKGRGKYELMREMALEKRERMKSYDKSRKVHQVKRDIEEKADMLRFPKLREQEQELDFIRSEKAKKLERELETYRQKSIETGGKRKRSKRKKKKGKGKIQRKLDYGRVSQTDRNRDNNGVICSINITELDEVDKSGQKVIGELVVNNPKKMEELGSLTDILPKNILAERTPSRKSKFQLNLTESQNSKNFKENIEFRLTPKRTSPDRINGMIERQNDITATRRRKIGAKKYKPSIDLINLEELNQSTKRETDIETTERVVKNRRKLQIGKERASSSRNRRSHRRRWKYEFDQDGFGLEGSVDRDNSYYNDQENYGTEKIFEEDKNVEKMIANMYSNSPANFEKHGKKSEEIEFNENKSKKTQYEQSYRNLFDHSPYFQSREASRSSRERYVSPYSRNSTKRLSPDRSILKKKKSKSPLRPFGNNFDAKLRRNYNVDCMDSHELLKYFKEVENKSHKDYLAHQRKQSILKKMM